MTLVYHPAGGFLEGNPGLIPTFPTEHQQAPASVSTRFYKRERSKGDINQVISTFTTIRVDPKVNGSAPRHPGRLRTPGLVCRANGEVHLIPFCFSTHGILIPLPKIVSPEKRCPFRVTVPGDWA